MGEAVELVAVLPEQLGDLGVCAVDDASRREQLRATLPTRRVVDPGDVAPLAVDLMTNTAVTGATFDIDGGQQLVES